jgi:chromosome segregation protein
VEPLLQIAEDLERRDERAAEALRQVEGLQHEVDELRTHGDATASLLGELPAALAAQQAEERAAGEALPEAEAALRAAEAELARAQEKGGESGRLAAARAAEHARATLEEATLWLERARQELARLEREQAEQRGEAERLERRASELATRLGLAHDVAPPGPGLDGALEWAARARGELVVAHAGLATERDNVVREASELVASVLGEPLASTSVADARARLARALGSGSA